MKTNECTAAILAWADLVIEKTFAPSHNYTTAKRVHQARNRAFRSEGIRRSITDEA